MLGARIEFEGEGVPTGIVEGQHLRFKVGRGFKSRMACHQIEDDIHFRLGEFNRQKPVLDSILPEYICKTRQMFVIDCLTGRDDYPITVLDQGPDGMLPAGTTAEIVAGDQDGPLFEAG